MSFIIRIYCSDRIYSLDLSRINNPTIGGGNGDSIFINAYGLNAGHIKFTKTGKGMFIKGKNIFTPDNSRLSSDMLEVGKKYILKTEPEISIVVHPKQSDRCKLLPIAELKKVTIGRKSNNDVVLKNMRTSGQHCEIFERDGAYILKDLNSSNGTYLNGVRIYERALSNNDIISVSVYQIMYNNKALQFFNTGEEFYTELKEIDVLNNECCENEYPDSSSETICELNARPSYRQPSAQEPAYEQQSGYHQQSPYQQPHIPSNQTVSATESLWNDSAKEEPEVKISGTVSAFDI